LYQGKTEKMAKRYLINVQSYTCGTA